MPEGREGSKMERCVYVHILGRKVYVACTVQILHDSPTYADHTGTQHECELDFFEALYTTNEQIPIKKSGFFNEVVQTLPARFAPLC